MELLESFIKAKKRAEGSKWGRFVQSPFTYAYALLNRNFNLQTKASITNLFWGEKMMIQLPASTDILINGTKSHDSELRLTGFLIKNLKENTVFIDVGAHFGFYTLLASKIVGENGKVYAFEASPQIFKTLQQNTLHKKNIVIQQKAVSNQEGILAFYDFPMLFSEYNSINVNQYKKEHWIAKHQPKKIEVETLVLDKLNLSPDFIKIDVEGAEKMVIGGLENTLKKNPKTLIALEYLAKDPSKNYFEAALLLQQLGFYPHIILEDCSLMKIELEKLPSNFKEKNIDSENLIFKKFTA